MPFTSEKNIKIFVSHASEDTNIVDAIARTLRSAFVDAIEITMMSEFPAGTNWRKLIIDSVGTADVLIAVASGRLKPSHSFTGMEVGAFLASINTSPKMAKFDLDRKLVPFAILAKVPDTVNDFQGIDLGEIVDVRFDEDKLQEELDALVSADLEKSHNKILKLLLDIEGIKLKAFKQNMDPQAYQDRHTILVEHARKLCGSLFIVMLGKEKTVLTPKTKLIIRISQKSQRNGALTVIEQANIRIEGNCYDAFGLQDTDNVEIGWKYFTSKAEETISLQWKRALNSLVSLSKESNFVNDNYVLSYDGKRSFRIFTSKYTEYYGNDSEIEVYVVEMLKRKDYGDKLTTIYLQALEVALRYRFMFLEETSEFSPLIFAAENPDALQRRVSEMIDELNFILLTAQEYGLDNPTVVIGILGKSAIGALDAQREAWERDKAALYKAATDVISLKEVRYEDKNKFGM